MSGGAIRELVELIPWRLSFGEKLSRYVRHLLQLPREFLNGR